MSLLASGRVGQTPNRRRAVLFKQFDDLSDESVASKPASWFGLEFARSCRHGLRQFDNASRCLRLRQTSFFCEPIPVPRMEFAEFVLASDFHRHFRRERGVHHYRKRVVKLRNNGHFA